MQAPCWNVWKQSQLNFRATVPTGCTSSSLALWLSLRKWAAMLETRRLSTRSEIFYFGKIFHRLILRLNKASTLVSWHLWTMPPGCQLCFFFTFIKTWSRAATVAAKDNVRVACKFHFVCFYISDTISWFCPCCVSRNMLPEPAHLLQKQIW